MLADLGLAAAILAGAALLLAELRHWLHPLPPAGSLRRRYHGAPPRRRLQLPPLLPRWRRRHLRAKARKELQTALPQLVVALNTGQSLSTALLKWPAAVSRALGPGKWVLVPQIRRLRAEIEQGATPEEALTALGDRLDLDEVRTLAHAVRLCRRRGGDLGEVVSRSAAMLTEALEVRSQMHTLTAGKRAEGLLLTFLPPAMLLILTLTNPSYALPLVQTNAGRLILIVALLLEAACFSVSRWLLQDDF